jgi:hypothetical protein
VERVSNCSSNPNKSQREEEQNGANSVFLKLTESQICGIFGINPVTLKKLIHAGKFSFTRQNSRRPVFDMKTVSEWVINNPLVQLEEAEQFAVETRDRLLAAYYSTHTLKNATDDLYIILDEYCKPGSSYLEEDKKRSRSICEKTRSVYHHFIAKKVSPIFMAKTSTALRR